MKKKQIRTIIISALVLLLAVTAILRINIEPAVQTPGSPTLSEPSPNAQEPSDATPVPDISGTETTVPSPNAATPETEKPEQPPQEPAPGTTVTPNPTAPSPTESSQPEATIPVETPPPTTETPIPEPASPVCTIEIRCDTVADTSKLENPAVAPYIPASGVILGATEIEFTPGESVFDILLRATRESNIHMEFREDNLYSGKYIQGINYLYEFDGGPLSGWMYKVNGKFPNYGCAAFTVSDGDAIVWLYTCDLGMDVGDNSTW